MATDASFIDHVCDQAGLGGQLSHRKMFGEYALYLDGKVVAFACDNSLFLKPTEAGRAQLKREPDAPPYPGAKLYFRVDDALDDPPLLRRLLQATAAELPLPKPKRAKGSTPSAARKRQS
jgi:TfoX/Sxy family transcriptional regulator of competence genes